MVFYCFLVIALFVATPIAYTPDMIPEKIKPILYCNPLYYYVSANQHLILMNKFPPIVEIVCLIIISTFVFFAGLWIFKRARVAMLDLI